jgi:general secretion pathway protein H
MGTAASLRSGRPARQSGFTLLEMIIVLVILALTAGLLVGRGPLHSQRLDLDASARSVAASLRLARSRAIAQGHPVTWFVGARGFSLDGAAPQALPRDVTSLAAGTIGFAPDGSSSGGHVILQGGSRRVSILVDWLTGRVQLAETH